MTYVSEKTRIIGALSDKLKQCKENNKMLMSALFISHCLQGGLDSDKVEIDWDNETAMPVSHVRK